MKDMSSGVQAGMVVEPDTLDLHIRYLRHYFEIIPLSDLKSDRHGYPHDLQKRPRCVLTFDDGWRDFYDYAYPVLQKHEAPATVFLPTDFIGTDRWFWTDRMGFLLNRMAQSDPEKRGSSFSDPLPRELVCLPGPHEARLEKAIARLKPYTIEKIEGVLSELSAALGEDFTPASRAFLSWEEVQEMSRSRLVCFGSHTAAHPLLTTLTEKQARHELRKSMDALIDHKVVDTNFISFCYPDGKFSESLSEMVREVGYHLAVTTQRGWHRQGADPYTLKRIGIHQDMASTQAMFGSRIVDLL
jgi:peptidoglycan/xylan/chitin deacetylase (PgdA/CDA1 family)